MIGRLLAATSAENIGMLINNANARCDVLRVVQWLLIHVKLKDDSVSFTTLRLR